MRGLAAIRLNEWREIGHLLTMLLPLREVE